MKGKKSGGKESESLKELNLENPSCRLAKPKKVCAVSLRVS